MTRDSDICMLKALNTQDTDSTALVLNAELPVGEPPEWVQLIPATPHVVGRDGRAWVWDQVAQAAVMKAWEHRAAPASIDWEHAGELLAPQGHEAPAAAWITELQLRDGALWGRVDWNRRAANQIREREYRFLSPAFNYSKTTRRIASLCSVALTNNPNLRLPALNRADRTTPEEEEMDLSKLCELLGLPPTATMEEIVKAVTKLKTAQAQNAVQGDQLPKALCTALGIAEAATVDQAVTALETLTKKPADDVDLNKFVPRPDYDKALNRAGAAEAKLKDIQDAERETKITSAVDEAQAAGKIAPASRDFYLAMCRKEGGLEDFQKFVETAPKLIADPEMPAKPGDTGKALNAEQQHMADVFGNTPEDLAKYAG